MVKPEASGVRPPNTSRQYKIDPGISNLSQQKVLTPEPILINGGIIYCVYIYILYSPYLFVINGVFTGVISSRNIWSYIYLEPK